MRKSEITFSLSLGFFLSVKAAFSAGMSSLTAGPAFFDNSVHPVPRVAAADESVDISFAGDWFASGACALYVDDVRTAVSDGPVRTVSLPGVPEGSWKSYRLVLKTDAGEETRIVTVFPSHAFSCSVHSLIRRNCFLDARPAGTVRKIDRSGTLPVTWSSRWSPGADRTVVTLHAGSDAAGACLGTLVSASGGEGAYPFCPKTAGVRGGRCTLVHDDGVQRLVAYLNVTGGALRLLLR